MNKKIELKNNTVVLFFVNLGVLISLIFFKWYFTLQGFIPIIINVAFVLNIILFLIGCIFIFLFMTKLNSYDEKKSITIIIIIFIIYLLLNTIGVSLINKPLSKGYAKIAEELSSYCDTYICDRYETITDKNIKDFIIRKTYFDYDNVENDIEIHTTYDNNSVIKVSAVIDSKKELFSERLIKDELNEYFSNFGVEIDEKLVKKAFDNRSKDKVKKDNMTYKVTEMYEDETLIGLQTEITLILKQG